MGTLQTKRHTIPLSLTMLLAVLFWLWPDVASAYPWMIRHEYTGCVPCHADPSGSGLLTEYGRAQGEILLRTPYGRSDNEEPSKAGGLLWGLATPPDWLLLGGSFRSLVVVATSGQSPVYARFVQMQTDLKAQISIGPFRANGTLGYQHDGALAASITTNAENNLVSREHWIGISLVEDALLLRAGRMNVPFGIRGIEHTLWSRALTRTDINDTQQLGVALAYNGERLRGEAMGILGNYQMSPDEFRERGYSAYLEASVAPRVSFGLTSLLAYRKTDLAVPTETVRQAHGAYARAAPWEKLVLLGEGEALIQSWKTGVTTVGYAGVLQADLEPYQGVHTLLTGEIMGPGEVSTPSIGGWLSIAWFFAPHADLRIDGVQRRLVTKAGVADMTMFLAQLHLYL
jgi:hypothetical protein